jgi:hypothetical protein
VKEPVVVCRYGEAIRWLKPIRDRESYFVFVDVLTSLAEMLFRSTNHEFDLRFFKTEEEGWLEEALCYACC